MPHTHPSCLTSLKSLFKLSLMHQNSQSTFTILFKQQRFLYKPKSPSLLLFICLIERKFRKSEKNNWKKSSSNLDKQEKEMISQKRYLKKFFSKSIKIPIFMKNLAMNSNTFSIIVKTLKKYHKPKFTNTSNVIGNILPHNKLLLKSLQPLPSVKLIFLKTWAPVLLSLLMYWKLCSVILVH